MEFVILAAVVLGLVYAAHTWKEKRDRAFAQAIREVAASRGLELTHGAEAPHGRATGVVDGAEVTVDTYVVRQDRSKITCTRVQGTAGIPTDLRITEQRVSSGVARAFGMEDAVIGDAAFDQQVLLCGFDPRRLRALMDASTRTAVLWVLALGGSLEDGRWTVLRRGLVGDAQQLGEMVDAVIAATAALRPDGRKHSERLRHIVETDPVPKVRLNALRALGDGADPDWLEGIAAGEDPELAVVAAAALGPRGRTALAGFLGHPEPSVRRSAATALSRLPPGPEAAELEAALRRSLADDPSDGDVIEALGRIGTAASVPDLQAVASSGLGLSATARQAGDAIRAIQSRIVGGHGALALADDGETAGALSLAEASKRPADGDRE